MYYADDTVILASSTHDLQRMLDNNIVRVSRNFGMKLNEKKTKVMVIKKARD